jgi:hypothetical protein
MPYSRAMAFRHLAGEYMLAPPPTLPLAAWRYGERDGLLDAAGPWACDGRGAATTVKSSNAAKMAA